MQTYLKRTEAKRCDHTNNDELAEVLIAISVVSKRLARKLITLSQQEKEKGEKPDEQDE